MILKKKALCDIFVSHKVFLLEIGEFMSKINLNGQWQGICYTESGAEDFSFNGAVPGCVHTDLMGVKIPMDIYYRDNADACQWIENRDFKYTKTFNISEVPQKADLVFEGLDVYADVYVNGTLIASTDDMFIEYRFDIAKLLKTGENTVSVYFHSPIKMVEGLEKRDGAFTVERMHTRRVQCTYGWDWVARLVTCGIWRDVYIDCNADFAVKDVYVYTESIDGDFAQIVVEAEFENYQNGGFAEMQITAPDGEVIYKHRWFRKEDFLKQYMDIKNPKLWYPTGYGEQPLYTLKVCDREYKFGIRTVRILEAPDEVGSDYYNLCLKIKDTVSGKIYDRNEEFSGFLLLVNNTPIMCKGANWVPTEPFPSAEEDEKITKFLSLAKESGLNMLRVWGGGIFEKQHFYNECDRLGILVTQDFLMACGHYPEEKAEFIEHLRKEAKHAALMLRNHPCLMWWSGDNENAIHGYDEAEDYHGRTAIHQGIMPMLKQYDPRRRFLLSSPCGGEPYASKTSGTTHNTQYLGEAIFPYIAESDMVDYKEYFSQYLARFIAEEPTMGAINYSSLKRFMSDDDIYNSLDMWEYHTKSNPGLPTPLFDILINFTTKVLGDFKDGYDRFFKLKYVQYEWIRISMENIRRNRGFCNGIVYWMWNDCWPASTGWSFVDYYCLPKASFYSFKRCAGNLLISIDKQESYEIYLCNDSLEDKNVKLTLGYIADGSYKKLKEVDAFIKSASSSKVYELEVAEVPEDAILICDAKSGNESDRAFYKKGNLPVIPCDNVKVINRDENSITISAEKYVHAVELEGEYIFEDNYFSVLPCEERTISFIKTEDAKEDGIKVVGYTL